MPPFEGPFSSTPFAPGRVVAGKYRVERVLGRGGMGVVLAAIDVTLERRVALKVMLPERAGDREGLERFVREGRAAVKLASDHVARVYEVGTSEGAAYLVMEYLDGLDLEATLAQVGRAELTDAVDYILHACEAIAEAHQAGIVHRDLKPQNIFLARRPNGRAIVKVLDFGISKMEGADAAKLTKSGATLGTPLYMAPEQMRSSRTVDPRADIWALGVLLYELVTGRPPFLGESITEVVMAVTGDAPAAPRSLRAEIPEALENVILRCLQKDPAARYPTVAALVADLEPLGSGRNWVREPPPPPASADAPVTRVEAPTQAAEAPPAPPSPVRTDASWGTTAHAGRLSRSRSRRRAVLAAVAVGAGGLVVVVLGLRSQPLPAPLPPPAAASAPAPAAAPPASVEPAVTLEPAAPTPPAASSAPAAGRSPAAAAPAPARNPSAPPTARPPKPRPASAPVVDPGSVR